METNLQISVIILFQVFFYSEGTTSTQPSNKESIKKINYSTITYTKINHNL